MRMILTLALSAASAGFMGGRIVDAHADDPVQRAACELVAQSPTDWNLETCFGVPVALETPVQTYALLATAYTPKGPVVYLVANEITGPACIAGLASGLTPAQEQAIIDGDIAPEGEGHVPTGDDEIFALDDAYLSCELAW